MKKTFTKDTLRKFAAIAPILLVGLLCGSAASAGTVSSCAAASFGPTPTNTIGPVDCTGMNAGTLEAWMIAPFNYSTTSGTNTGSIYSAVYLDAGMLDFYYQVVVIRVDFDDRRLGRTESFATAKRRPAN